MPGQDLVSEMREGGNVPVQPSSRNGLLDALLAVVAAGAIGVAGYFAFTAWLTPKTPVPQPPALVAVSTPAVVWTDADSAACKSKAIAAANAPIPDEMLMANPAVTEGFAGFSARLECHLSTKPKRLCDPTEKAAMVALVNDYLGRVDVVGLGLGLQGAPMKLLGNMTGGEIAMGSEIYDIVRDHTVAFMGVYQKRVANALRRLAQDGIMAPSDFAGPFGMAPPEGITRMFGDVQPQRHICS